MFKKMFNTPKNWEYLKRWYIHFKKYQYETTETQPPIRIKLIKGTNHRSFCEKHRETEINQMAFDDEHILVVIINFDREHGKDRVTHGFTQALISALPKSTPWMCARSTTPRTLLGVLGFHWHKQWHQFVVTWLYDRLYPKDPKDRGM